MISMSQTYSIRQLRKSGDSVSEIAHKVGVSRNTVYAKLAAPDLSPQMPVKALKQIFEHVGGIPARIVFDNATGVGRRIRDKVRTTETFTAFAAHYGFAFPFCNPNSGHEKGIIESKVRFVRSKDDAEQLRRLARALYISNETIEWFLASSNASQLRAVSDLIGHEMEVQGGE